MIHEIAAAWIIGGFIIYNKPNPRWHERFWALIFIVGGSFVGGFHA